MAISDRDFYASHGISYDVEEMQIEYTKRVINQAKIELLAELQLEIPELKSYESANGQDLVMLADIGTLFKQKITALKENT